MKTTRQIGYWLKLVLLGLISVLTIQWTSGTALANVRLLASGPPAYARIESGLIHNDGEWAAIAFYRPPDCIPAGFNLLDFVNPAALECPSFVAGFEVWKNGPWTDDPAPLQSKLDAAKPMPIWFVRWSELQEALFDDELTIGELAGLPSLVVGTATFFTETLHPSGGAQQTKITVVSSGFLEDGRCFTYRATETKNILRQVKIEFR